MTTPLVRSYTVKEEREMRGGLKFMVTYDKKQSIHFLSSTGGVLCIKNYLYP
jgi:hypothetical protein